MFNSYSQKTDIQQVVYRILDTNLDRTREGLRILEEWCRFGLNSIDLAHECKKLRQEIGGWHATELRMSRNTQSNGMSPGTSTTWV